jgi:hypothetical protein
VNLFIITLDSARLPHHFADAASVGSALAADYPHWRLVKKLDNVWELSTSESLETIREVLPEYFTVQPMVYAHALPPRLTVRTLRDAIGRGKPGKDI